MYNIAALQTCLLGIIGFRQTEHPDYPQLSEDLIASTSGLTFQDVHPLIDIQNIVAVAPRFDEWEEDDKAQLLSDFLTNTVKASAQKVVNAVIQKKKLDQNTKSIFQDLQLYHGSGLYSNKIIKENRFVGFEINLKNSADLAVIISALGTQFDTENPEFKLYLFRADKSGPVKTFDLDLQSKNLFGWADLEAELLQGGPFYLGYYESDLVGQALRRTEDLSRAPCQTCIWENVTSYKQWSQYVSLRPFYVEEGDFEPGQMWDPGMLTYVNDTNWGLNLKLSVQCDISNFLCRYKAVFTDALGLQVAVDLIEKMIFSVRDNDLKSKLQVLGAGAMDNSQAGMPGLRIRLDNAINALDFDLSGFDSRCLPCQNSPKIKYRTI